MNSKDSVATVVTKLLQDFVARDLLYVLGGLSIEICFYFLFYGILPALSPNPFEICLLIGSAYVISYAVQDILSLTGFVTTSTSVPPGIFVQWLYKRFTGKQWSEPQPVLNRADKERLYLYASPESLSDLRRMTFLKHVGATMGSSWFLCGCLLFLTLATERQSFTGYFAQLTFTTRQLLLMAICLTFLSLGLLLLGRLKSEQQKLFMSELYNEIKQKDVSDNTKNSSDPDNQLRNLSNHKTREPA